MKNFKFVTVALSLVVLSACGSKSSRDQLGSNSTSNNTAITYPTPSGVGNVNNLPAAQQQQIQLSGMSLSTGTKNITLDSERSTSRKLRIKVTALSAPNMTVPGYTNWVFPYGCMRVTVTVNGSSRQSKILKVSGMAQATAECQNAPSSDIIDFSDITTGYGNVSITYSNAEYDNCRYYNPMAYGCGMSAVWQNHQVRFNTTIETDGYYMQ